MREQERKEHDKETIMDPEIRTGKRPGIRYT